MLQEPVVPAVFLFKAAHQPPAHKAVKGRTPSRYGHVLPGVAEGVEALKGVFRLLLELLRGHPGRFKNGVMPVVKVPLPGQEAPLFLQLLKERRPRQGGQGQKLHRVDPRFQGKIHRVPDGLHRIAVFSKDKHAVDPDPVFMKLLYAKPDIFRTLLLVQGL